MTREDYLTKLATIDSAIVCGLTLTYDMGFQFTVLTADGTYTDLGNFACWPCSAYKVTDEIREIRGKLLDGVAVSDEELLNNDFFKDACTFYSPIEGTWLVEGEKLRKTLKALRVQLIKLDLSGDEFYSYVRLEDWASAVYLFKTKDELRALFLEHYKDLVFPYTSMGDQELEEAYNMAKDAGWNAIPVFSSSDDDSTSA